LAFTIGLLGYYEVERGCYVLQLWLLLLLLLGHIMKYKLLIFRLNMLLAH